MSAHHQKPSGGTPATRALGAAGVDFTSHEFVHDAAVESFGLEAATALGVAAERVFKTLVAQLDRSQDKGLVVAIVPVDRQLDLKALAREFGCKRAAMADATIVERTTGYLVGGISPIGQKRSLATVLDRSATSHPTILVSGGRRGLDVELTPADLVSVSRARVADVAR
ncbi:Cys-tRNA(Pro)/Cys-tRNA(Cys) deacylase [Flexivirga endophytica]|uniref:Cys-tRNA(Pro)/Cys-tRNA(Cys) deacylase n=1 Tax=Flexivirga endophytica TaxID=1849103 RepID=A0A916WWI1_9MICO|nr:Cys-tRNA(Pro) deacylase [Flexivirga endophytica]GGB35980.1 Cys-tRNA(Pro)/Cys-tRNA(Cys) deacylase [Flexivirga endophytica]GHB43761.1 Cys-tRNA(Pro)/Cys-tRNA(Cys) deacylase [Flexivirga endophytica]